MSNQFEQIAKRQGNGSMKWEKAYIQKRFKVNEDKDIFPLFIADMDYRMDTILHEELLKEMKHPDFGYFHIQDGFYQSIINWHKNIHQLDIKKEWILPCIGTVTSLNIVCDIYAKDKDILILTPVYGPFAKCGNESNVIRLPLIEKDLRYTIDFVGMRKLFEKGTIKILLFCNPHNPSGRMWNKEELLQLVELCKEFQVILLADEIHSDIILSDKKFVSVLSFHTIYDQILVCTSPNKTFNISGLSTSYILSSNSNMLKDIQAYLDHLHISCNRMGVMMIEKAYTYGYAWYKELLIQIKSNVELVYRLLSNTDIEVMKPDSGYLIWMRLANVKNVDAFMYDVAKETHVLVETGSRFVENYEGWIRINVATSTDRLEEAMKRFIKFYKEYSE